MDTLASECSSGCESGWTLYLDRSLNTSQSHTPSLGCYEETKHKKAQNIEDSDEEDLSMVSDASSGPPHHDSYFNAQDCSASKPTKLVAKRSKKRQKVQENNNIQQHLDDTASSPLFDNNNVVTMSNQQTTSTTESMLDYSQGFSATYFEERSSLQDHFGFLQPSLSQNEAHINKKWYGGEEMGMI
ncbi:hypothetical protein MtrunA17_Chr5g0393821 [Medicago truncatula]|uniref:Uncharacterized protein n=1 Tax=Medicago truncatula TaxID=3880 RepID=G7K0Y2_MEDTR|nr:protein SOB FIVE-LIKE 5 [Medicago truncatula]AES93590.1 hypothetical protein MTR_5g005230 [Medicago truncatula]RHN53245.1 hypothetical protein MtrunA17_Chr5g0393821 [Medicago truncatula]